LGKQHASFLVVQKQLISSLVGVTSDKAKPIVYHNLHLTQKPFSHFKDSSGSVRNATVLNSYQTKFATAGKRRTKPSVGSWHQL
jgi:hypothetical protein